MDPIDPSALPPPAQKVLSEGAPPPMKMMAAKGIIPGAKPADIVTVLVGLSQQPGDVAKAAVKSLDALAAPILDGALSSELQPLVIHSLVDVHCRNAAVVEKLLRQQRIHEDSLKLLAERATEATGELIAVNETLLLKNPKVIEALYLNKQVRMSTADRILELAVRNGLQLELPAFKQAAQAIVNELIPEPTEEETYDDALFRETQAAAERAELADSPDDDTHERDDEGEERVREKFEPLYKRLSEMTVSQKIRRAMLGTAAERMLLVRETNRLVASAAASSPQLNENDAARIAASRAVIDDVLRIISNNRNFTRNYQVKLNLVMNPKTPFTFSSRMITHLRDSDLRSIVKSKNVPANVQTAARQHLIRKQKR